MTFDWTISLGHLITIVGFIFGGGGFIYAMKGEVKELRQDVRDVKSRLDKFGDILVAIGRQDERMTALDRRVDDLQHGRGFVLDGLPRSVRSS